ncbi:MAG: ABC transporter ATP-binding protein [Clostridiales bacterium]|nr:ABC transporter ATP-binding protein [Clostridiales bacterium]
MKTLRDIYACAQDGAKYTKKARLLLALAAICGLLPYYATYRLISHLIEGSLTPALCFGMAGLIGGDGRQDRAERVWTVFRRMLTNTLIAQDALLVGGIMLVAVIVRIVLRYWFVKLESGAGYEICERECTNLGQRLRHFPMRFFNEGNLGNVTSVITVDLPFIEEQGMSAGQDDFRHGCVYHCYSPFLRGGYPNRARFCRDIFAGLASLSVAGKGLH